MVVAWLTRNELASMHDHHSKCLISQMAVIFSVRHDAIAPKMA